MRARESGARSQNRVEEKCLRSRVFARRVVAPNVLDGLEKGGDFLEGLMACSRMAGQTRRCRCVLGPRVRGERRMRSRGMRGMRAERMGNGIAAEGFSLKRSGMSLRGKEDGSRSRRSPHETRGARPSGLCSGRVTCNIGGVLRGYPTRFPRRQVSGRGLSMSASSSIRLHAFSSE